MLRRLSNQIFACKLIEAFENPLVLVYQTLDNIDRYQVQKQLRADLAKNPAVKDAAVTVYHMKNTVAAATGDSVLTRLFTNSNIMVGFKPPQQQQDPQSQHLSAAATMKFKLDTSLKEVLGGLLERQVPGPHIPQPALKAFVEMGAQLPSRQPMVLIGAFYQCTATPVSRLKKWIKLDTQQVYGELLGVIDSPVTELLAMEGCVEDLLECFDEASAGVADVLDHRAATAASTDVTS